MSSPPPAQATLSTSSSPPRTQVQLPSVPPNSNSNTDTTELTNGHGAGNGKGLSFHIPATLSRKFSALKPKRGVVDTSTNGRGGEFESSSPCGWVHERDASNDVPPPSPSCTPIGRNTSRYPIEDGPGYDCAYRCESPGSQSQSRSQSDTSDSEWTDEESEVGSSSQNPRRYRDRRRTQDLPRSPPCERVAKGERRCSAANRLSWDDARTFDSVVTPPRATSPGSASYIIQDPDLDPAAASASTSTSTPTPVEETPRYLSRRGTATNSILLNSSQVLSPHSSSSAYTAQTATSNANANATTYARSPSPPPPLARRDTTRSAVRSGRSSHRDSTQFLDREGRIQKRTSTASRASFSNPNAVNGHGNETARRRNRLRLGFTERLRPSLVLVNSGSVARDHLASERTFLAYVRTSLAIASSGVALVQLFSLSDPGKSGKLMSRIQRNAPQFGAVIIAFGVSVLLVGVTRYFTVQSSLTKGSFPVARVVVLSIASALAVLVLVVFGLLVGGSIER